MDYAKTAALMIDVQLGCVAKMGPQDARGYLDALGQALTNLRHSQATICWVSVADDNRLYTAPPSSQQAGPVSTATLTALDYYKTGLPPEDTPNFAIFDAFMKKYGPRTNEVLFTKTGFGAFGMEGHDGSLEKHLKDHAIDTVLVMGTTTQWCCLKTAVEAVQKGFADVCIVTDRMAGWKENANDQTQGDVLVFGADPAWHHRAMDHTIRQSGYYTADDRNAFARVRRIAAHDALAPSVAPQQTGVVEPARVCP